MRGSWKIGRLAGIGIYVHWSFLILPLAVGLLAHYGGGPLGAADAVVMVMAIFGCVLLHELGHALMARRFGIGTRDITLLVIGGVARLDRMPTRPVHELAVALAGPAVNVVIGAAILPGLLLLAGVAGVFDPASFWARLFWANVILVVFNLLPAFPMDGGRVLRALLAMGLPYQRATDIAAGVGQVMAVLFAVAGVFFNWTLILVGLFVFWFARAEARMTRLRGLAPRPAAAGSPIVVADVMQRAFLTLDAAEPIGRAAEQVMFSPQLDYPVLNEGHLVGMVRRSELLQALSSDLVEAPVGQMMRRDVPAVDERALLGETMTRMQLAGYSSVPVSANGLLVGVLSAEHLQRWLQALTASPRQALDFG